MPASVSTTTTFMSLKAYAGDAKTLLAFQPDRHEQPRQPRRVHDPVQAAGAEAVLPPQLAAVRDSGAPRAGSDRAARLEHQRAVPQVSVAARSRLVPPGAEPSDG